MFRGHKLTRISTVQTIPPVVAGPSVADDEIVAVLNRDGTIIIEAIQDAFEDAKESLPWLTVVSQEFHVIAGTAKVLAMGRGAALITVTNGTIIIDRWSGTSEAVRFRVGGVERQPAETLGYRGFGLYRLNISDTTKYEGGVKVTKYGKANSRIYVTKLNPPVVSTERGLFYSNNRPIALRKAHDCLSLDIDTNSYGDESWPWLTVLMNGYQVIAGRVTVLASGEMGNLAVVAVGSIVIHNYRGTVEALCFTHSGVDLMPEEALKPYLALYDRLFTLGDGEDGKGE